jgi:hypothetical protein
MALADTLFHTLATMSCCHMATQKPAPIATTQKICKSRGRLIAYCRAGLGGTQAVPSL